MILMTAKELGDAHRRQHGRCADCHREWKKAARRDGKLVLLCVIHARQQARKARGIRPDWMDDDGDTTLFPPWV
jgi:hypothetical protein